jgi:hypothetical protein
MAEWLKEKRLDRRRERNAAEIVGFVFHRKRRKPRMAYGAI